MASSPWMGSSYSIDCRSIAATLLLACSVALPGLTQAAEKIAATGEGYPSKPVRIISPFAAGGGTDVVGRVLAQRMSELMGRVFIVDNRGGAEGAIGTELGARAPADGHTLLIANLGTFCLTPNLRKVGYDPLKDFAPITQTTASSTVLVTHPSLPVRTVKELVALAKTKPGQINYGASSNATALPMEMLQQMAGVKLNHVPYKGTGPALLAVMGGEVTLMFGGSISTVPQVKNGKLRALAVAGDRRTKALPDVPTVAEAGFPGYEANTWNGIVAPVGTPSLIIDKLNAAMTKGLQMPEVRDIMVADGAEPVYNTPEQFGAYIRACHAKWAKVIKVSGFKETQ